VEPSHYARFEAGDLTLRDMLALDRTLLANERTLLAYLRTAMALLIAGATMINFAEKRWFLAVGVTCLVAGIVCGIVGVFRFLRTQRSIGRTLNRHPMKS